MKNKMILKKNFQDAEPPYISWLIFNIEDNQNAHLIVGVIMNPCFAFNEY